jgi:hypothetical protein
METIAVLASRRQVAARSYRADRGKNHDPVGRRLFKKPRLGATPAVPRWANRHLPRAPLRRS